MSNTVFPIYNNQYAVWLGAYEWTHTLTLSPINSLRFCKEFADTGEVFAREVRRFLVRLNERIFGRRSKQTLYHATFFENYRKNGSLTYWHSHSLVTIPPCRVRKFEREAGVVWSSITRKSVMLPRLVQTDEIKNGMLEPYVYELTDFVGSVHSAVITDAAGGVRGAAQYASKFSHLAGVPMQAHLAESTSRYCSVRAFI